MENREVPTRRVFLRTAVAGAAAAAAARLVSEPSPGQGSSPERERLERLAATYGSEIGGLRRVSAER